ncbi:MAG: NFACT family protein [candidate division Zixibacteria bacterium]|nr:NFACT family protein [candidate division Zixibacteria bacterium]
MINSLLIYCLLPELKEVLENGGVSAAQIAPDKKELFLFVKKQNQQVCLLLSIDPENYRAELLTPQEADAIQGEGYTVLPQLNQTVLERIEQLDFDRIIDFHFVGRSQFEKTRKYRLVAELTGRNSNLILVDKEDDEIVWQLRGAKAPRSKFRQIKAGVKYLPPSPPKKINPLTIQRTEFEELVLQNDQTNLLEFLKDRFSSIDSILAMEIIQSTGLDTQKNMATLTALETERLFETFNSFFGEIRQLKLNPQIVLDDKGFAENISVLSLPFIPQSRRKIFPTVNQAIKTFHSINQREVGRNLLYVLVSRKIAKLATKFEKLQQDLEGARRYKNFKKFGDLLMANIRNLRKGMERAELVDLFSQKQERIIIPLESSLGPIENAQKYFEKSRKDRTAINTIRKRLEQTDKEKTKLNVWLGRLGENLSPEEIDKIRVQLENAGYLPKIKSGSKSNAQKPLGREFVTPDGYRILVGRNDQENDFLSFKLAKKDDLWFHADRFPGSHVVLLKDERKAEFSRDAITWAASLAAYFSKARNSKKVSVIYTLAKYLRKPKGVKAGLVRVNKEKSIVVTPKLLK